MTDCWWVYIVGPSEDGPVKVGLSKNPEQRIKELQTGHPRRLRLWRKYGYATRGRARYIERRLHYNMKQRRQTGEWFDVPVKLVVEWSDKTIEKAWRMQK